MSNDFPLKFSWGLFCHTAITDKDTGQVSIINIIPSLKIEQIKDFNLDSNNPNILLSLGKMFVVGLFERLNNLGSEINESLDIELLQVGLPTVVVPAKISIKKTEYSAFINLNCEDLILNISPLQDIADYKFEVIYKNKNQELGRVILPVEVIFKSIEE